MLIKNDNACGTMMDISLILEELSVQATGTICDAITRLQCTPQVLDVAIRPILNHFKITAPAFTVKTVPGSNAYIHQAIYEAPPGSVLIVDVNGHMGSGHVGGLMSNACKYKGIKGIIIDGTCRDVDEIIDIQFPVFARGFNPNSNQRILEGLINQTVHCGGIEIHPGDIICADVTGIVVIPYGMVTQVLEKVREVVAFENTAMEKIKAGISTVEIFNLKEHFAK